MRSQAALARLITTRAFSSNFAQEAACPLLLLGLILSVWLYQFLYESRARRLVELAPVRMGLIIGMILYIAVVPSTAAKPFIYFQF